MELTLGFECGDSGMNLQERLTTVMDNHLALCSLEGQIWASVRALAAMLLWSVLAWWMMGWTDVWWVWMGNAFVAVWQFGDSARLDFLKEAGIELPGMRYAARGKSVWALVFWLCVWRLVWLKWNVGEWF